jgi:hypothetical protein
MRIRLKTRPSFRCTLVLAFLLSLGFSFQVRAVEDPAGVTSDLVKASGRPSIAEISPFMLFFAPDKNRVILEPQRIDYDLTQGSTLRMGPYFLPDTAISLQMTKEQGEFFEVDFGFEVRRRLGSIYVLSFRWPKDYLGEGVIEIMNERGESYWKRSVTAADFRDWQDLGAERGFSDDEVVKIKERLSKKGDSVARPQRLSPAHKKSVFGLAHRGFFEIPISQINEPFRFCLSREDGVGRVALCSSRYEFVRASGQYVLKEIQKEHRPRVMVNDKEVTLKGSAIFLDFKTPIKFSALLKNGTYYEFIARPKEIRVVDMVTTNNKEDVLIIGYGDQPMGEVDESFYADTVYRGFLNFMPTIGDLRRYWRATISTKAPYLYLKGDGGAPFRQVFTFDALPTEKARVTLAETTQRNTYKRVATLSGTADESLKLSSAGTVVRRTGGENFEWDFLADKPTQLNRGFLGIKEGRNTWYGEFDMYRGLPAELSARLTAIASLELDFVLLGEVSGQYWFESLFGWDNHLFSNLRWGISAKRFQDFFVARENPVTQGIVNLAVTNVDLKYRLTPGVWGRDPTTGLLFGYQSLDYGFRQGGNLLTSRNSMVGGGLFWARSMPKFLDDFFNLLPAFRYPKWVDTEALFYPLGLETGKTPVLNVAFNFHGKVQWTPRFFGEAGFGLKTFNYDDPEIQKKVGFAVTYGTIGVGINF